MSFSVINNEVPIIEMRCEFDAKLSSFDLSLIIQMKSKIIEEITR